MINYWATPNMGKMHMMQLIEVNKKSYTKIKYPYYFYKQWHHPSEYNKRIEKTFVIRKGHSKVETPIKTKTTFGEKAAIAIVGERHEYLNKVASIPIDDIKLHSNTSEVGGDLMEHYFGRVNERRPPDVLMKDKDPVEVFFTDKWFRELQKYFPVSPSTTYLDTFLEPYLKSKTNTLHPSIQPFVDELCDVDFIFDPFSIMGRHMLGRHPVITNATEIEKYVIAKYKTRKNIIPYKENLIDCFASKLKRYSHSHVFQRYKTENASELYKIDKGLLWKYLDTVVKQVRRIELYFKKNNIETFYFNMDRDNYKDIFGFQKDDLERTSTHPGDYPEREEYEKMAKEYVMMRKMKDMRRRGRIYDWL